MARHVKQYVEYDPDKRPDPRVLLQLLRRNCRRQQRFAGRDTGNGVSVHNFRVHLVDDYRGGFAINVLPPIS